MPIYRPRMGATLTVPILGTREQRTRQVASTESFNVDVHPKSVSIEHNDHNHADTCSVVIDWIEAGCDPRLLDDATIEVHIANANSNDVWLPSRDTVRFAGLVNEVEAHRTTDEAADVTLSCVDYTTLFLKASPFGSNGVPTYDQTLDGAWQRIVSQTPGAEQVFDKPESLVLEGLSSFPKLSDAVSARFARLARIPVHPQTDAWAVWQQCVGMMGLISYIRGDQCIVTTATNYYTAADAPLMIWGHNILEWSESRVASVAKKGIGLTSFDPLSGRTIEAFWPPIGDPLLKKKYTYVAPKKVATSKTGKKPTAKGTGQSETDKRMAEDREYFALGGVTNLAQLTADAKRIWEERSRQELEGRIVTHEMFVATESRASFDLLRLAAGDSICIEADPDSKQLLASLPTDGTRIRFLTERGYSPDIAALMVRNMAEFARLESKYMVKTAKTTLSVDDDGGSFSIEVTYCNRILIDGSTDTKAEPRAAVTTQEKKALDKQLATMERQVLGALKTSRPALKGPNALAELDNMEAQVLDALKPK